MNQPLNPDSQARLKQFFQLGLQHGCPRDQLFNFIHAGLVLQHKQLAASAAARLCDQTDGPADALRYLAATPIPRCYVRKLTGY